MAHRSHGVALRRRAISCVLIAGTLPLISACAVFGTGGGGDPTPSKTGNVSASYSFPSSGAPHCTAHLIWRYEPVSLTGSAGKDQDFNDDRNHSGPASGSECRFTNSAFGLKLGRWRVTVLGTTGALGSCEVDVKGELLGSSVAFKHGTPGCERLP